MTKLDIKQRVGQYTKGSTVGNEEYYTYIPKDLPPTPPLVMDKLFPLLEKANVALGRLDGIRRIIPDPDLFIFMFARKEAVLSSQIEGTQSSLSDLLLHEADEQSLVKSDDIIEVKNYNLAMEFGLNRLKEFPLSLRLLREIHEILMNDVRGSDKRPGEFRTSQNWIGGSRPGNAVYVPPPPEEVIKLMGKLELFIHDDKVNLPILVKAALAHVQFETIHPFLDGNGRLGRLLITFMLCNDELLDNPLLYLSLFFKQNRQQYYDLLQSVRETGNWEEWIEFFLKGVVETATQASETAQAILTLFQMDKQKIEMYPSTSQTLIRIHRYFQKTPISNSTELMKALEISRPTILKNIEILEELKVIREITGKKRHKVYAYANYMNILIEGTEPL